MKLRDILSETTLECTIGGISYDSRTTEKGDVFVAVTGYKTDGHAYAKAAEQRGAVCVVAERALPELCIPCVVVPDARRALAEMAQEVLRRPDVEAQADRRDGDQWKDDRDLPGKGHFGGGGRKGRADWHKPEYDRRQDASHGADDAGRRRS